MELLIATSILSAGFLLQKGGINRFRETDVSLPMPKNAKPNGPDPYTDHRSVSIWRQEQEMANRLYEKSKDSLNTNVMIPGPPMAIFNKGDGSQKGQIPMTFRTTAEMQMNTEEKLQELRKNELVIPDALKQTNDMTVISDGDYATSGGWDGIDLLGNVIQPAEFRHNNEIPYFGGTIKQNVDENAQRRTMEDFTGQIENARQKQEVPMNVFSPPVANLSNPYGMSNLEGYNVERYWVSGKRNNEAPTEPIFVGPGLNQGFTNLPSGGFQQANTRDYVLPKTTDEIRVLTNPKVSYAGRVVAGKKVGKPGKIGLLQKYRPTSYFENQPERFFTTTGQITAPTMRPHIDIPLNERSITQVSILGPAGPTEGSKMGNVRPNVNPTHRRNYRTDPVRNLQVRSQKAVLLANAPNDYGKKNIDLRPTTRPQLKEFPTLKEGAGGIKGFLGPKKQIKPRFTKKLMQIGNLRWGANLSSNTYKGVVWDPRKVARTTIKETTIDNDHKGIVAGPEKGQVWDANDIARTTVKETTIDNDHKGIVAGPEKGKVWDANDIARTTVKETTIDNDYLGAIAPVESVRGGYTQEEQGYDMPWTARDQTLSSYTGGAYQKENEGKGYITAHAGTVALPTHRESTSIAYTGAQGPTNNAREPSRQNVKNATTHSLRQEVSKGRPPPAGGPKRIPSKNSVHFTTWKEADANNCALQKRAPAPIERNPLYYRPPRQECTITKEKETLPNQVIANRIEPEILDAYRSNPFTQSLSSFFFP